MEEWKEYKLGDIVEINPTESLKKGTVAKKIGMDVLQPYCRAIPSFSFEPYTGGTKFKNGDTIMARITPCLENGKTAMVNILDDNEIGFGSTEYIVFRAKNNITDPYFIYYLVTSDCIRNPAIKSMVGSSGRQRVQTDVVANLSINLPPLPTQQKIAAILSSLDDKIELNNKINTNLEQQAQALFKNWFVDKYEKEGTIGDYCSVKSGFAFKSSWWQDEGTKVIRIGDIEQGCLNLETCAHVADDKIEVAKDFIVQGGDLVIAMTGATIGKFSMIPKTQKPILVNQRVGKFFLGNNPLEKVPFIYCTLKQEEVITEFINRGQGSAQPNISTGDILSIPCWIPSKNEIDNFNRTSQPMFETIISNQEENRKLSKVRDILLPKLMSGQIDAYKIEF